MPSELSCKIAAVIARELFTDGRNRVYSHLSLDDAKALGWGEVSVVGKIADGIDALTTHRDALADALEAVEYVNCHGSLTCPWCGVSEFSDHRLSCQRQAALKLVGRG